MKRPQRFRSVGTRENSQKCFELYRLRAEEYERSFLSLRTVEWQVAFQAYAAFASIAIGFFTLIDRKDLNIAPTLLGAIAIALAVVVLGIAVFWQFQIQSRHRHYRDRQNAYLKRMHKLVAPELTRNVSMPEPKFKTWWAFVPMLVLYVLSFASVVGAILVATPPP